MAQNPMAVGLLLVGITSLLFAYFIYRRGEGKDWSHLFILLGGLGALLTGYLFIFTPIPGHYVELFGTGLLLFSLLLLTGGMGLRKQAEPRIWLGIPSGIVLIWIGHIIRTLTLTQNPVPAAALFSLAGVGSMFLPFLNKERKHLTRIVLVIFALLGLLAFYMGLSALQGHVVSAVA